MNMLSPYGMDMKSMDEATDTAKSYSKGKKHQPVEALVGDVNTLPKSITDKDTIHFPMTINQGRIESFFPTKNSIFDPMYTHDAGASAGNRKVVLIGNPGVTYACAWCGFIPATIEEGASKDAEPLGALQKHLHGSTSSTQGKPGCPIFMAKCHPFLRINQFIDPKKGTPYYRPDLLPSFKKGLADPKAAKDEYGSDVFAESRALEKEFDRLQLSVANSKHRPQPLSDQQIRLYSMIDDKTLDEELTAEQYEQVKLHKRTMKAVARMGTKSAKAKTDSKYNSKSDANTHSNDVMADEEEEDSNNDSNDDLDEDSNNPTTKSTKTKKKVTVAAKSKSKKKVTVAAKSKSKKKTTAAAKSKLKKGSSKTFFDIVGASDNEDDGDESPPSARTSTRSNKGKHSKK
eukprot:CAMPEP_0113459422 /NCGR_PEP_ID=MMETSP0014_2-20120614/10444_1 /TAXON_ID=2857 /ORGANISM="Nitzschia sp." /LENGTH=401 /DNA_ID=CAMNT_0000351005 /DNA_START=480 /DNA_END=1685 /DNA_ORIENTATION=- /assembly_acc=CAM_ASM_000159